MIDMYGMCGMCDMWAVCAMWDLHARSAMYAACALVAAVLRVLNTSKYGNAVLRACTAI